MPDVSVEKERKSKSVYFVVFGYKIRDGIQVWMSFICDSRRVLWFGHFSDKILK